MHYFGQSCVGMLFVKRTSAGEDTGFMEGEVMTCLHRGMGNVVQDDVFLGREILIR